MKIRLKNDALKPTARGRVDGGGTLSPFLPPPTRITDAHAAPGCNLHKRKLTGLQYVKMCNSNNPAGKRDRHLLKISLLLNGGPLGVTQGGGGGGSATRYTDYAIRL